MRYLIVLLLFFAGQATAQNKLYEIEIASVSKEKILLKQYEGKKILIATANAEQLAKSRIQFLDSIQKANPQLQVIIAPAEEADSSRRKTMLETINSDLASSTVRVLEPSFTSKKDGERQNSLMRFLTTPEENQHFQIDAQGNFQMFIINESGFLFAVIEGPISNKHLEKILKENSSAKR